MSTPTTKALADLIYDRLMGLPETQDFDTNDLYTVAHEAAGTDAILHLLQAAEEMSAAWSALIETDDFERCVAAVSELRRVLDEVSS